MFSRNHNVEIWDPEVFLRDVSAELGFAVTFGDTQEASSSATPSVASASSAPAPQPAASVTESVEQMHSKVVQANKLGFIVGAFVTAKVADAPEVWCVQGYCGDNAKLVLHVNGHATESNVISAEELLDGWRLHKGVVTALMPGYSASDSPCCPLSSAAWKFDLAKSAISLAMRDVYQCCAGNHEHLELLVKPHAVRSKVCYQPGELSLAPATLRIERKESAGSLCVGKFDLGPAQPEALHIAPQFNAPLNHAGAHATLPLLRIPGASLSTSYRLPCIYTGEPNKSPWVCPFYHISSSPKSVKPNMALKCVQKDVLGTAVRIPILVNIKTIEPTEEILWDKSSSKTFPAMRSYVTEKEIERSAKRRRIST